MLLFFIPGFFLVQALFPLKNELDEEYDFLYRVSLGIALSVVITTLDGFVLGSLGINPATDKGYWDSPYIIGSLLGFSIVLFVISWYRGAYPMLSRKKMDTLSLNLSKSDKQQYYKLMDQWKKVQKQKERYNNLMLDGTDEDKELYKTKISELDNKLTDLEGQLTKLSQKDNLNT